MDVVETDAVVSEMLADELRRCEEAFEWIEKTLSLLPKGILSPRRKLQKGKEYSYHYLKFREGGKVFNQHVADDYVDKLRTELELRKKYELEAKVYRKRISYLKRLLKIKGLDHGNPEDK
jgi:hypothetical protein